MRERLIELIKRDNCRDPFNCSSQCKYVESDDCHSERLADLILADGWIRLPCKVGDTVYFLHNGEELCEARIIRTEDNYYTNPQMWITVEFFSKVIGTNTYKSRIDLMLGKTVFLTREEAEQKLKEGKG